MSVISPRELISKSGKKIIIRPAQASDAAELLQLGKAVMDEEIYTMITSEEYTNTPEQHAKWIEEMNAHPSKLVTVATFEDRIVASLDFTCGHRKRIEHTGEFAIIIADGFREERIGTELMASLLSWAKAHPTIEKVNLRVNVDNQRAVNLYLKMGFIEEGRLKNLMKYGPSRYVDILMMGCFVKPL